MQTRSTLSPGYRTAEFVGRPPPSDDETIWIDADYIFDLMVALSDLMHSDGLHGSSYLLERTLDLFLFEIGRSGPPSWKTAKDATGLAEEIAQEFKSYPKRAPRQDTVFQSVRRNELLKKRSKKSPQVNEPAAGQEELDNERGDPAEINSHGNAHKVNHQLARMRITPGENYIDLGSSNYSVTVGLGKG